MTRIVVRHRILWGLILLGAATGFLLEKASPPDHLSTALVEASVPTAGGTLAAASDRAAAEVGLVAAPAVLSSAMTQVGWSDPDTFRDRLEVKWVTGTPLISVSFRHNDVELASQAANAVAASFVERRRSLESEGARAPVEELDTQVERLQAETTNSSAEVRRLRALLGPSPSPGASIPPAAAVAREQLQAQELLAQAQQESLTDLRIRRDDVLTRSLSQGARIVQLVRPSGTDGASRSLQATAVGAVVGVLILLARHAVRRLLDRLILRHREAALRLDVAGIGALRLVRRGAGATLFVRDRPASPEADDLRALHLNLLLSARGPLRSVLVSSTSSGRGGSLFAANLALASAERGTPTVLVEARRRHPSVHQVFGIDPDYGLLDLLADPSAIDGSLSRFFVADRLFVIPVGGRASGSDEPIPAATLKELIDQLGSVAEGLVVIDGEPMLDSADTLTLAPSVQGVLLVADPTRSPPADTRRAIQRAKQVGARVVGVALDRVERTTLDPMPRTIPAVPARRARSAVGDRRGALARGLLLTWAALLGVQFALLPGFNLAASDFVLAALLLVVLTDRQLRRRALHLPAMLLWFFATMSLAIVVGSLVTAFTFGFLPTDAWLNKGLGLGVLAVALACVRAVANTRESVYALLRALLLGAIVSTAVSLFLWLNLLPLAGILPPPPLRFTGFLTNPNAAALYYTVGLLLLFATFGGAPLGLGRWSRIAGVALLGIGNVLTVSLSALVSGVAAFGFMVVGAPRGRGPAALALLVVLIVALPSLSAVAAPATAEGDVFDRATASRSTDSGPSLSFVSPAAAEAKGSSVFDRIAIDVVAVGLWSADVGTVVFGIGLGAFQFYAGLTDEIGQSVIIHNSYLWLIVEMGALGLAALALLLWYVVELSIRLVRLLDPSTAVPFVAMFVLFLVWWQFNEGLYQRVFWLLLGAASVLAELAQASILVRPTGATQAESRVAI